MNVETSRVNGTVRLQVAGEIDLATADEFEEAINQSTEPRRELLIDLTQVTFIDSTALGVIVRASTALSGRLEIKAGATCERFFSVAGVRDQLPLV